MKWFENAYDRANAAEYVLQTDRNTDEYHPGFRRISWQVSAAGGVAIMNHFPRKMIFNREEGYDEPVETPYFAVHFQFTTVAGVRTEAFIQFDDKFAYLCRSGERDGSTEMRDDQTRIWDEAMATLDESLLAHAQKLGWGALPPIVEAVPAYQESNFRLAA